MTERELRIKQRELAVRVQTTRVGDAKVQLDQGYARLTAEFERSYTELKNNLERELIRLEREKACLEFAKDDSSGGIEFFS